jgi:hypothetical protein
MPTETWAALAASPLLNAVLDNPQVRQIGKLALPNRVKIDRETQRRYEKVFGGRITRDW